jgi:hypothetical protein
MRRTFLVLLVLAVCSDNGFGQTTGTTKKIADSICDCLSKKDTNAVKTKEEANAMFMGCFFTSNALPLLTDLAAERRVDLTDQAAMRDLGLEIAKELMHQNCTAFANLSIKMASDSASSTGVTGGKLARIEDKQFRSFVVTDAGNREQSFIWVRYFQGSEKFIDNPAAYVGKPLKIRWQEVEVFLPGARGYFKIKEITGVDVE